jgi:SanA protein
MRALDKTELLRKRGRLRPVMALLVTGAMLIGMIPLVLRELVLARYGPQIYVDPVGVPGGRTALVFGAAVRNGRPTTVLRDRLDAAIQLYQMGKVERLLLSGDGRELNYDEPGAMARYAIENGVAAEDVVLDRQGLRTYASCYRAAEVYDLQELVLVTQTFHLPRALFTCELLGIKAVGLAADQRAYRSANWYSLREMIALTVAAWDGITRPVPDGLLEP